ncbi:hypothetical protein AKO1_000885 [Acrasis kona]|uniref:Uncharacterized protein n=1 Tax=Acrasis kona TaxID=1008807 RepID=A0AAW2ZQP3_9EUKA
MLRRGCSSIFLRSRISPVFALNKNLITVRQYSQENRHDELDEEEKLLGKSYHLTEEQKLRNKFLQFKREHGHDYLGAKLAPTARSDIEERAREVSELINSFFISEEAPKQLSYEAQDLWSRLKYSFDFISKTTWHRLNDVEKYEEWQAINLQHKITKLNEKEAKLINPLMDSLNKYWTVALRVEHVYSIVDELVHKYQNTYTSPKEDQTLVYELVEEYVELSEIYKNDSFVLGKLTPLLEELTFLKQKLVMPGLSVRYPVLFK